MATSTHGPAISRKERQWRHDRNWNCRRNVPYNVQQLYKNKSKNKNNEINGSSYCMQQLISPLWKSPQTLEASEYIWRRLTLTFRMHLHLPTRSCSIWYAYIYIYCHVNRLLSNKFRFRSFSLFFSESKSHQSWKFVYTWGLG